MAYKNPSRKSVMKHDFSKVPSAEIPRSVFNRTHGYKTTFDAGYLIPFYADEALPGDTFNLKATLFARIMSLAFLTWIMLILTYITLLFPFVCFGVTSKNSWESRKTLILLPTISARL